MRHSQGTLHTSFPLHSLCLHSDNNVSLECFRWQDKTGVPFENPGTWIPTWDFGSLFIGEDDASCGHWLRHWAPSTVEERDRVWWLQGLVSQLLSFLQVSLRLCNTGKWKLTAVKLGWPKVLITDSSELFKESELLSEKLFAHSSRLKVTGTGLVIS